jgi:acyl dehydratase
MPLDYAKLKNRVFPTLTQRYTARDTILYALGVGAGLEDPLDPDELRFVYEEGLRALPTMAVVLANEGLWLRDPQYGVHWKQLLHGEQMLQVHRPLPAEGTVVGTGAVEEIYDKGEAKGAIVYQRSELRDAQTGELLVSLRRSAFLRGDGGFGGKSEGAPRPHPVPADRAPDLSLALPTRPEQALLYRLSGDYNPLHILPSIALDAGYPKPILHGLCTYGIAGRAILRLLCGNDPARLRRLDVRFSAPVFPGDTLRTEVFRTGPTSAALRCIAAERGVTVLGNGLAEYT